MIKMNYDKNFISSFDALNDFEASGDKEVELAILQNEDILYSYKSKIISNDLDKSFYFIKKIIITLIFMVGGSTIYIKGSKGGLAKINFEINCDRDINTNPNWNNTAHANFIKSSGHDFSCIGDNKFKGDIYFYTEITAYGSTHLGPAASEGSGYSVQITYEDISETVITNPPTSSIPIGTLNSPSVISPTDGLILNNNSSVVNNAKVTFTFKHPYITQSNGVNANVMTTAYIDIYDFSTNSWVGNKIISDYSYNSNVTESLITPTLTYGHNYLVHVGAFITGYYSPDKTASTTVHFSLMQHPTVTAGTPITKA